MVKRLILIRHGATDFNLKRRYCGWLDIGLNKQGKAEIKKVALKLRHKKIDKVYSSAKLRALESARLIFKDREVEIIPELKEMNFGVFEGLTYGQISKIYPRIYKKWLRQPHRTRIPQAETLKDFKKRVLTGLKKIVSLNPGKTVAVILHGGSISAYITSILKSRRFWKYIPASASISVVEYRNGKPKILAFNDTKHLNG